MYHIGMIDSVPKQEYPKWRTQVTADQHFDTFTNLVSIVVNCGWSQEKKWKFVQDSYRDAVDYFVELGIETIDVWRLNNVFIQMMSKILA